MSDIATDVNSAANRPRETGSTRLRLRRAACAWNRLLDAGVDRRKPLPPVRDYPYPTE